MAIETKRASNRIALFLLLLAAVGTLSLRFYDLDWEFFWRDEVTTVLRINGYAHQQIIDELIKGEAQSVEVLKPYLRFPAQKSTSGDALWALAKGSPMHSPLFFVLTRWWAGTVGDSLTSLRLLSVLVSLLIFPAAYWFGRELFGDRRTSLVLLGLIAISPLFFLYAREIRPYSLWTATIFLSNAALLRALKEKTAGSWAVYGAIFCFGCYTHMVHGLLGIAHGLYMLIRERYRPTRELLSFFTASIAAVILFIPWLLEIDWRILFEHTNWLNKKTTISDFLAGWVMNCTKLLILPGRRYDPSTPAHYVVFPLFLLTLCIGARKIWKELPRDKGLLILILLLVPIGVLAIPDLITGGQRSTVPRYLFPWYTGVYASLAYLFSKAAERKDLTYNLLLVALIGISLYTTVLTYTRPPWTKSFTKHEKDISRFVNSGDKPLLVVPHTKQFQAALLVMSHFLKPKVDFIAWLPKKREGFNHLLRKNRYTDIYIIYPPRHLTENIVKEYQLPYTMYGHDYRFGLYDEHSQKADGPIPALLHIDTRNFLN